MLIQSDPKRPLEKRGQLIERVKNFQPHEHECCDHQIITKMHAGLETNTFRGPCGSRARPSTKLDTRRKGRAPGERFVGNLKSKASAAAEVMPLMPLSRDLFLTGGL